MLVRREKFSRLAYPSGAPIRSPSGLNDDESQQRLGLTMNLESVALQLA